MMACLQRILVALDGSFAAKELLSFAHELARRQQSELVLCSVVDDALADTVASASVAGTANAMLQEATARLCALGVRCSSVLLEGRPADAIVAYAQKRTCDAILVGTRGRDLFERMFLGSTTQRVLRLTLLPVFVIHQAAAEVATEIRPANALGRYLVAVDGSDPSNAALAFAASFAAKADVLLCCNVVDTGQLVDNTAIYGCDPAPFVRDVRAAALALIVAKTASLTARGRTCETSVLEGDTASAILAAAVAQDADIIVCGSHGKAGIRRSLLGGVVQSIVARSTVPVVVIRQFQPTYDPDDARAFMPSENSVSIPSRVPVR